MKIASRSTDDICAFLGAVRKAFSYRDLKSIRLL